MANADKGEVTLSLGGKSYTLRLSTNAMATAEGLLDKEIGEIVAMLARGRLSALRVLLWAALIEKHPRLSLIDAGEMIDADREGVGDALGKALAAAFPEAKENPQPASGEAGATS